MTALKKLLKISSCVLALTLGTMAIQSTAFAQSSEYIVFEINGEVDSLTLGAVLKDGDKIHLNEGVEVRLLDKAGAVIALKGPFKGTVTEEEGGGKQAEEGSKALNIISKLVFGNNDLVNTLGASRAIGEVDSGTSIAEPWMPVINKPGTYCLSATNPKFGRKDENRKTKITLLSGSEIFIEKIWEKGEKTLSIADLVKSDTDRYTLFLSSQQAESTLHLGADDKMSAIEQIAWMAERGCKAQAVQLLKVTMNED